MPPEDIARPATIPVREKIDPTERSMPPVITTSRTPNDISTRGAAAWATFATLPMLRACGIQKLTKTSIRMTAAAIASSVR